MVKNDIYNTGMISLITYIPPTYSAALYRDVFAYISSCPQSSNKERVCNLCADVVLDSKPGAATQPC